MNGHLLFANSPQAYTFLSAIPRHPFAPQFHLRSAAARIYPERGTFTGLLLETATLPSIRPANIALNPA
jgi:hypothetical protein